jgi:hypothetical protein
LVINRQGLQIATISDRALLDGPWDLTILDGGSWAKVFVSNVLNGTVTRLDLDVDANNVTVKQKVQIGNGYAFTTNDVTLVLGPTGLAFDPVTGILYVASTLDNEFSRSRTQPLQALSRVREKLSPGIVTFADHWGWRSRRMGT